MPWIAEHQGTPVTPEDVSARDTLTCPKCGDEMHIRGPYTRSDGTFVARHFSHNPDGSTPQSSTAARDCGGETDEHKRMKSVAYSKVKHVFGDLADEIEFEMAVKDSGNIADIGVIFTDDVDTHDAIVTADCISGAVGDRLAIEVQYRNESKDIQGTARTYAEHGYSVLWLYLEQFSKYDVELFTGDGAVWTPV